MNPAAPSQHPYEKTRLQIEDSFPRLPRRRSWRRHRPLHAPPRPERTRDPPHRRARQRRTSHRRSRRHRHGHDDGGSSGRLAARIASSRLATFALHGGAFERRSPSRPSLSIPFFMPATASSATISAISSSPRSPTSPAISPKLSASAAKCSPFAAASFLPRFERSPRCRARKRPHRSRRNSYHRQPRAHQKLTLSSRAVRALPKAIEAIKQADLILLGPGSLYTSILPNLLIPEIAGAIANSKAPRVYVAI